MTKLLLTLLLGLSAVPLGTAVSTCKHHDVKQIAVVSYISQTFKRSPELVVGIVKAATNASVRYGIPVETVLAVIAVESSFNPMAKSKAGGTGLMQLTVQSGKEVVLDVQKNVDGGTELLLEYRQRFGSKAHQIYNVGATGWKKGRRAVDYARKVESYRKTFERLV